jgi:hypothetical protein
MPDYPPPHYCQKHYTPNYQAQGDRQMVQARNLVPECFNHAVLTI